MDSTAAISKRDSSAMGDRIDAEMLGNDARNEGRDERVNAGGGSGTSFNGVICFGGEDWWYHNRGHYDMQMMREFSARVPVLYVNSLGMRVPRVGEGAMFLRRVRRKLKSIRRGLASIRSGFSVLSPLAMPGRIGTWASKRVMPGQVRRAARKMGITRPLVWVACPPGAEAVEALGAAGVVYQRTDRFEAFPYVNRAQIEGWDRRLKGRADLTLYCSRLLYEAEKGECRRALFVDHGVDFDRFAEAGMRLEGADSVVSTDSPHPSDSPDSSAEPADLRGQPRPRVGFIGGIDAHTFDPPLFVAVARALPEVRFVLVGACSLPEGWCPLPNVVHLGQRPYDEVPGYMAGCDVLIMPWNQSEWIKACNPVKLKEYLATGRPVVSTWFDELKNYEGFVRVAGDAASFVEAIRASLREQPDAVAMRARVRRETWTAKAEAVMAELERAGLTPPAPAVKAG